MDFVRSTLDQIAAEIARAEGARVDADEHDREQIDAHLSELRDARRALTGKSVPPRGYAEVSDAEVIDAISAGRDVFPRRMPSAKRQRRRRGER